MLIRIATENDLPAITAIYNSVIEGSDAIYRTAAVPLAERQAWFNAKIDGGYPVLVAEKAGSVVGYGVYGNFRFGEGYDHTVEHSVHVQNQHRGKGIGTALLARLIELAIAEKRLVMVAAIDSKNSDSIALHEKFGFVESARMKNVAKKNGEFLTLVLMQKILSQYD
jgi:L-amino acid N-acyltransferase YncA